MRLKFAILLQNHERNHDRTFNCAAILFDLDGVLVDSTRSVTRQWRRWADESNIDPQKVVEIAHGVRTIEIVRQLAPHLDAEAEVIRDWRNAKRRTRKASSVMPGAAELLEVHSRGPLVRRDFGHPLSGDLPG